MSWGFTGLGLAGSLCIDLLGELTRPPQCIRRVPLGWFRSAVSRPDDRHDAHEHRGQSRRSRVESPARVHLIELFRVVKGQAT
jgi:hypothetical protein